MMKNTKEKIQKALIKLLKTSDIYNIRVKELVEECEISRSTFYLYFNSTYDVLESIEKEYFALLSRLGTDMWDYGLNKKYLTEPHPIIYDVLKHIKINQGISVPLWSMNGDAKFQLDCSKMVSEKLFPDSLMSAVYGEESEQMKTFLTGGHLALINNWTRNGCRESIAKMSVIIYKTCYSDILNKMKRI